MSIIKTECFDDDDPCELPVTDEFAVKAECSTEGDATVQNRDVSLLATSANETGKTRTKYFRRTGSSVGQNGHPVSADARAIIFNVYTFLQKHNEERPPVIKLNVADLVAALTGVSGTTVSRIRLEGLGLFQNGSAQSSSSPSNDASSQSSSHSRQLRSPGHVTSKIANRERFSRPRARRVFSNAREQAEARFEGAVRGLDENARKSMREAVQKLLLESSGKTLNSKTICTHFKQVLPNFSGSQSTSRILLCGLGFKFDKLSKTWKEAHEVTKASLKPSLEASGRMVRFFKLIKAHEVIYNPNHPSHRHPFVVKRAWDEISGKIGYSKVICRHEWANRLKRLRENLKQGKTVNKVRHMDELAFVMPYLEAELNQDQSDASSDNNSATDEVILTNGACADAAHQVLSSSAKAANGTAKRKLKRRGRPPKKNQH